MRTTWRRAALVTVLAVALLSALAGRVGAGDAPAGPLRNRGSQEGRQASIAAATWQLEDAFSEQFVRNEVDAAALSGAIDEVVQAMPEAARPAVREHIEQVLSLGQALAARMPSEERAAVASSPAPEAIDSTERARIGRWGWVGTQGWGGEGAFAFPRIYDRAGGDADDPAGNPPKCTGLDPPCAMLWPAVCELTPRCHLQR